MSALLEGIIGAFAGAAAGGIAGWFVKSRQDEIEESRPPRRKMNRDRDDQFDDVAATWASLNGMPEAAHLIARKLRLAARLSDRRKDGRS